MTDRYLTEIKMPEFADRCPNPFCGMGFSALGAKIMRIRRLAITKRRGIGPGGGVVAQNSPDTTSAVL